MPWTIKRITTRESNISKHGQTVSFSSPQVSRIQALPPPEIAWEACESAVLFLKQKPDEEDKERRKEVLTRGPTSPWAQWAPERAMWIGTDLIAFHKESLANHREGYDERAVFCCKDKLKIAC